MFLFVCVYVSVCLTCLSLFVNLKCFILSVLYISVKLKYFNQIAVSVCLSYLSTSLFILSLTKLNTDMSHFQNGVDHDQLAYQICQFHLHGLFSGEIVRDLLILPKILLKLA